LEKSTYSKREELEASLKAVRKQMKFYDEEKANFKIEKERMAKEIEGLIATNDDLNSEKENLIRQLNEEKGKSSRDHKFLDNKERERENTLLFEDKYRVLDNEVEKLRKELEETKADLYKKQTIDIQENEDKSEEKKEEDENHENQENQAVADDTKIVNNNEPLFKTGTTEPAINQEFNKD